MNENGSEYNEVKFAIRLAMGTERIVETLVSRGKIAEFDEYAAGRRRLLMTNDARNAYDRGIKVIKDMYELQP